MSNDPLLSGILSSDKAKSFISALNKLTKVGVEKVILNFQEIDNVKQLVINAFNTTSTVMVRVKFDPCFLDGITLNKNFKYGISKLSDFVGIVDIFKSGFEIKMCQEVASLSSNENYIDYYGSECSKIKECDDGELDIQKVADIKCDDSFKEFITATGRLEHKHIIFKGVAANKSIVMSVADKDVRGNTFSKKILSNVETDFKICINKEYFSSILTPGSDLVLYRQVIQLNKKEDLFNIEYLIVSLT